MKPPEVATVLAWERKGDGLRQIEVNLPATENLFELRGMTPGAYILYAEPQDSDLRALARQNVTITDRNVEGVVMSMVPASDIRGQIKIEDATEVPDMGKLSIELRTSAINFAEPAAVAGSLSFVLKGVAPARFEVRLTGVPENCFVKSIRYGGADMGDAGSEFIAGSGIEITLSATAGRIYGSVTRRRDAIARSCRFTHSQRRRELYTEYGRRKRGLPVCRTETRRLPIARCGRD